MCCLTNELTEVKQIAYLLQVATIHECLVNKISLLLLCLLGKNMTVESVTTLDLTSTGERDSLLCAGICLLFWHFC